MFKPLLAPNDDPLSLPTFFKDIEAHFDSGQYYLCSAKLDGFRNITKGGVCKSRKFIDLPSKQAQRMFGQYPELDGELIVGPETAPNVFNLTSSYIRSFDKPADIINYRIFDFADTDLQDEPFEFRFDMVSEYVKSIAHPNITMIQHDVCRNMTELLACEEKYLSMGYEGIMIRNPGGRYKHGRATWLENIIRKLKRFMDEEARVTGFEEGTTNTNEDIRDNLGHAKRSTAKAGMLASGIVGNFIVDYKGRSERIAPGSFKKDELEFIWDNQSCFLGKWLKFRHFPHGAMEHLRMARALGFRDEMDM